LKNVTCAVGVGVAEADSVVVVITPAVPGEMASTSEAFPASSIQLPSRRYWLLASVIL
jgi:hypothetical protein